ncbi:MAG: transcriptional repressor NrdR [Bdellovibrionales bacterium]|jgi:transcriptional repressor NrdR|nr:transcriptional repressor NrdR [Bdellovibrionales bacterium]MBT3526455.1 transcriptional repressor NrdR [Bdellovibrionales bacterium]MBT7670541.1 transcriptional repressor NrdR [Bdellovibrionales bacterium]
MRCPSCNYFDTKVIDSRLLMEGRTVRRRRKCDPCQHRFTTYEKIEISLPMIAKNDGRRESYKRNKLTSGIMKAAHKTLITTIMVEEMVDSVEKILQEESKKEITSQHLGTLVMYRLYHLDPVAYVRFASFYRDYQDIPQFIQELTKDREQMGDILYQANQSND